MVVKHISYSVTCIPSNFHCSRTDIFYEGLNGLVQIFDKPTVTYNTVRTRTRHLSTCAETIYVIAGDHGMWLGYTYCSFVVADIVASFQELLLHLI